MAQAATEDMLSIVVDVGGHEITGYAAGQAIRWAKTQRTSAMRAGLRGLVAFTKIRDKSATLELDLMPTSDDNDVLQNFLTVHEETEGGVGFQCTVRDISGRMETRALVCVIDGEPDVSIGEGGGVNTWRILGAEWVANIAGRGATPTLQASELPPLPDIPTPTPPV